MPDPVRLFILAGEPSGDRLGADLVRRLREHRPIEVAGVGGAALIGEGLDSLFPMSELAVMGFTEVLARLPRLLVRTAHVTRAILQRRADVVVLIDSQVLSATIARRLRRRGYNGPIVLYVAPSVWAWKPERAALLRPLFDEVLAILPFEPQVMKRLGGPPTSYVGHPSVGGSAWQSALPEAGSLLLLPGSRDAELRKHLPVMRAVAAAFAGHPRVTGVVIPAIAAQQANVRAAVASWPGSVGVVSGPTGQETAIAAAAKMGTVTLELALRGVPMTTLYVAEPAQLRRMKKYGAAHAALPNILAGQALVPEIITLEPEPGRIIAELHKLLDDPSAAATQRTGFRAMRKRMETGDPDAPLTDPAERIIDLLGRSQRLSSAT